MLMLCKATCLFIELKLLVASTNRAPSVSWPAKIWRITWIAAARPLSSPPQTWRGPTTSRMSCFNRVRIALVTFLLRTSPIPICLTPGHLSREITCKKKALRWPELTQIVHRHFPTHARANWLYINLQEIYFTQLDPKIQYNSSTWLYINLPELYFILLQSTLLYHSSTSLHLTLH